jgi:hypothetical protein
MLFFKLNLIINMDLYKMDPYSFSFMASNSLEEEIEIRQLIHEMNFGALYRIDRMVLTEGIHGRAKYVVHYKILTRERLRRDLDAKCLRMIGKKRYIIYKHEIHNDLNINAP